MPAGLRESRAWMRAGTDLVLSTVDGLAPGDFTAPSGLPDWSRRHLVAHLATNAEALGNLVHWARTGDETPMYSSTRQRADDIEKGAQHPAAELRAWARSSAEQLAASIDQLDRAQWDHPIRTAAGREVTATQIPWMRAREVFVHAVDLGTGVRFADLPSAFLEALVEDILAKRGMNEAPSGPLPDVAAYLAGRPHTLTGVPGLGAWL